MAIDTAEKRRSIAGIGGRRSRPGVTPNAAKDAEWRQEVGRSYSGIAASGIVWTLHGDAFNYDAAKHGSSLEVYFELFFRATTGTAYGRLFNLDTELPVTDSMLSTMENTFTRLRSAALTLTDGDDYQAQLGG